MAGNLRIRQPSNEEPFRIETGWKPIDRDEDWRERGVDTKAPENADLRRATASVEALVAPGGNEPPGAGRIREMLAPATELRNLLTGEEANSAADALRRDANGWLLEACAVIAASSELSAIADAGSFVRECALEAASTESQVGPDVENFDQGPYWGLPDARRAAAATLISLTLHPALVTDRSASLSISFLATPQPQCASRSLVDWPASTRSDRTRRGD